MKANFPNYYPVMITLTFAKPFKPSTSANLRVISNFINKLRNFYARKQWVFAYCRFSGVQKNRNPSSLDIHIILWLPKGCKLSPKLLSQYWAQGRIHITKVYDFERLLGYLVYRNAAVVAQKCFLPRRCRTFSLGIPRFLLPRFRYALIPLYALRHLRRLGFAYRIGIARWFYNSNRLYIQLSNGYIVPIPQPGPCLIKVHNSYSYSHNGRRYRRKQFIRINSVHQSIDLIKPADP